MTLENVMGNLLAYKELKPGTFQHVDQLTRERRTNQGLRNLTFYTADGAIYTIQKGNHLWAITRESQNVVLGNIAEAYLQLTGSGNYFPDAKMAQASLDHADTVVVELKGLKLVKYNDEYGYFVVNPKDIKKLDSEQRNVVQRVYGPDENSLGLNMEMFAKEGITPNIIALLPEYAQDKLERQDKKFLARVSWLNDLNDNWDFVADGRSVNNQYTLRGTEHGNS